MLYRAAQPSFISKSSAQLGTEYSSLPLPYIYIHTIRHFNL